MGQYGYPEGHAVVQDGNEAGAEGFHANLQGRIVDGHLQDARDDDPFPVFPRRQRQAQPGRDQEQRRSAYSEAVGYE